MFQSMNTIVFTITLLIIMISTIVLQKNGYEVAKTVIVTLLSNKKMQFSFSILFLILYFNKMEQKMEKNVNIGDFTSYIHQFEGDIVYYIQQFFMNPSLTYILTFFYIIVFPVLMVTSFVVYLNQDHRLFYAIVYALMLNYIIAIPFYLFFPVYEVWYFDHHVQFLIPQVYPNFDLEYRPLSGIDNNFPSLHTSISLTIALVALQSKNSLFGKITLIGAVTIIYSTLYLGIHWVLDLSAGALLAIIASQTGLRLSEIVMGEQQFDLSNQLSSKE